MITTLYVRERESMTSKRQQRKKASSNALLPERSYIDIALEFANHPHFKSVQDAQSIYRKVSGISFDVVGPDRSDYWKKWLEIIHREQRVVRQIFESIVEFPDLPVGLENLINRSLVDKIKVRAKLTDGRLQLHYDVAGIVGAAPLGVALLIHNDMADRLRQCGQCARFFLAEGNRNRARFCRGECADLNKTEKNAERQRVFNMCKWLREHDPEMLAHLESIRKEIGEQAYKAKLNSEYMKSKKRST